MFFFFGQSIQVIIANLLGISYGLVNFLAYLGFIFGEIDFYARLETSVEHFEEEQKRKVPPPQKRGRMASRGESQGRESK